MRTLIQMILNKIMNMNNPKMIERTIKLKTLRIKIKIKLKAKELTQQKRNLRKNRNLLNLMFRLRLQI